MKLRSLIDAPKVQIVNHFHLPHEEVLESLRNIDLIFFSRMGRAKSILIPQGRIPAITTPSRTLVFQEGMSLVVAIHEAIVTEQGCVYLHTVVAPKRLFSLGIRNAL